MADNNRTSLTQHPVFWIAAGGAIALALVTIVALLLFPTLIRKRLSEQTIIEPTIRAPLLVAASTAIPTFTPSPTLSPTPTPTETPTSTPSQTPTSTPTKTPTETPTITPNPQAVIVAIKDTRLYLGPETTSPEQGWLIKGKTALIISRLEDGSWWYVKNEYGVQGWAEASRVTVENDISQIPVVTPLPYNAQSASTPQSKPSTPETVIGPLELAEIWPVHADCSGGFKLDIWIKAKGGTGTFTYMVDGQIVAENLKDAGYTAQVYTPSGAWVGIISVVSGSSRIDKDMYFAPADWCN